MLTLFLKKLGHQVAVTENGRECVNAALKNSYDLLITDIDMPELNGIECTTQIRQAGIEFPIIAITATVSDSVREQCIKGGMNAFLGKPINFPELQRLVQEIATQKTPHHSTS
jgi:CheY-like chemotaxis protein